MKMEFDNSDEFVGIVVIVIIITVSCFYNVSNGISFTVANFPINLGLPQHVLKTIVLRQKARSSRFVPDVSKILGFFLEESRFNFYFSKFHIYSLDQEFKIDYGLLRGNDFIKRSGSPQLQ